MSGKTSSPGDRGPSALPGTGGVGVPIDPTATPQPDDARVPPRAAPPPRTPLSERDLRRLKSKPGRGPPAAPSQEDPATKPTK